MSAGVLGLLLVATVVFVVTPSTSDEVVAPASTFSRSLRAGIVSAPSSTVGTALVRVEPNPAMSRVDESWGAIEAGGTTIIWGRSSASTDTVTYVLADETPAGPELVAVVHPDSLDVTIEVAYADAASGRYVPGSVVLDERGDLIAVIDDAGRAQVLIAPRPSTTVAGTVSGDAANDGTD